MAIMIGSDKLSDKLVDSIDKAIDSLIRSGEYQYTSPDFRCNDSYPSKPIFTG